MYTVTLIIVFFDRTQTYRYDYILLEMCIYSKLDSTQMRTDRIVIKALNFVVLVFLCVCVSVDNSTKFSYTGVMTHRKIVKITSCHYITEILLKRH